MPLLQCRLGSFAQHDLDAEPHSAKESCDEVQGYLIGRPAPIDTYASVVGRKAAMATATKLKVVAG